MELYPLKMQPLFKRKVWGGRRLEKVLNKKLPARYRIGESIDVCDLAGESTSVVNGVFKGKSLTWLMRRCPREVLGEEVFGRLPRKRFPLVFKYIDATGPLSIQVHPPDAYAELYDPGEAGKVEAWFVVHAERGARVMRGLVPGTDRRKFVELLKLGRVEECIHSFKVQVGDVIFLPPGTVHCAADGVVLAEIQQASNSTYRIYDWGRTPVSSEDRSLNIEKALDVIDFSMMGQHRYAPSLIRRRRKVSRCLLMKCDKFTAELFVGRGPFKDCLSFDSFQLLSVLEGRLGLQWGAHDSEISLARGETVLVPASLGKVGLFSRTRAKFLRFY